MDVIVRSNNNPVNDMSFSVSWLINNLLLTWLVTDYLNPYFYLDILILYFVYLIYVKLY